MPLQSLTMWLRIRTRTRRWLCSCCETTWPSGLPTRKPEIETRQIAGMSAATTAVAESWLGPHTVLGDGGNPHRNWWAERWKRIRGCTCWRVTAPEKPGNSRPKRPEPTERKLAERTSHHSSRCGDCNTSPLQFTLNWLQMFRPGARVMSCRLPKMVTSLVQNCSDIHDVHDVDHIRCAMPMKCMSCVWISEMAVWFWGGVPEAGIWGLPSLNQWSLIGAFHIWWFWCLCPAYDSLLCFAEPGQFSFWPSLFLLVWECSSTFCIFFAFCRGLKLLHWNLFQTSCSREPQSCFAFAMPRDKDVYFAKLAEQAERYP